MVTPTDVIARLLKNGCQVRIETDTITVTAYVVAIRTTSLEEPVGMELVLVTSGAPVVKG